MAEAKLLCQRPHANTVDFENSRFIVSKACGLTVNGVHLQMGQEVPRGVLTAYALRCEYEPPLARIELLEYALEDPDMRVLISEQPLQDTVVTVPAVPFVGILGAPLEEFSQQQLVMLCTQRGLETYGNRKQLLKRLRAVLG